MKDQYKIIDKLNDQQVQELHVMYQDEWWTKGRSLEDVKTMLVNSDIIFGVVVQPSNRLIGFVRVLTDTIFKAMVYDLIVHPDYRNEDIGTFIMSTLLNHSQLKSVNHIDLQCLNRLSPFYKQCGFTDDVNGLIIMRKMKDL